MIKVAYGCLSLVVLFYACTTLRSIPVPAAPGSDPADGFKHENIEYALPLPMAKIIVQSNVEVYYDTCTNEMCTGFFCTQTINLSTYNVPDDSNRFYLRYRPNVLMHDNVSITLDDMSFIKDVNLTGEDRTPAIVTQISGAALQLSSPSSLAAPAGGAGQSPANVPRDSANVKDTVNVKEKPKVRDTVLSPCPAHKLTRCCRIECLPIPPDCKLHQGYKSKVFTFSDTLITPLDTLHPGGRHLPMRKYITLFGQHAYTDDIGISLSDEEFYHPLSRALKVSPPASAGTAKYDQGIYYRPLRSYKVAVKDCNNQQSSYLMVVPDLNHVACFPLLRAPFIKKVATLSFNNGMLNGFTLDRPSQVEGFISIPIDLAKAIVGIPAQLISIKINTAANNSALMDAKIKGLQSDVNYKLQLLQYQHTIDSLKQQLPNR